MGKAFTNDVLTESSQTLKPQTLKPEHHDSHYHQPPRIEEDTGSGKVIENTEAPIYVNESGQIETQLNHSVPIFVPRATVENDSHATMSSFPKNISNVNSKDPEKEFLQTVLDSCRSTIAKQESEVEN